jgi:hypothetical protein
MMDDGFVVLKHNIFRVIHVCCIEISFVGIFQTA